MVQPFESAKTICRRLKEEGYIAYFAGGWVRDLILGITPDEIDIATSAPPAVIQQLFPKTIPVGIAFGVIIVVLEGVHFEVATFRSDASYKDGRHPEGVSFSSPEEDAQRRDFTINGMFYDPFTQRIYDYVGGKQDLNARLVRAIGNPEHRFFEDRLRMIRGVRFAARLQFHIESSTESAIKKQAATLFPAVSMERVWQEFCKMSLYPHFDQALLMLYDLGILNVIFPQLKVNIRDEIVHHVAPFPHFPSKTPTILYVKELLSSLTLAEMEHIALYLKTPVIDQKWIQCAGYADQLFLRSGVENYEWAQFYADDRSCCLLGIREAKLPPPTREAFRMEHHHRKKLLSPFIERMRAKKPLVSAHDLKGVGLSEGKLMGFFLKEAERLSVNLLVHSPDKIIEMLKEHPLWPKKS